MIIFICKSFFKYSPKKAAQMYRAANYNFISFISGCFSVVFNKFRSQ
jgi:hypothetical protein